MKRIILSAFVAVTILGLTSIAIVSKAKVNNKVNNIGLETLVGNSEALGGKKITFRANYIDEYRYTETTASKYGVEKNQIVNGDLNLLVNTKTLETMDRKLARGLYGRNIENKTFAVALGYDGNKGLTIRYKNKEVNKGGEFLIKTEKPNDWKDLTDMYLKDDLLYGVLSSSEDSYIFKVSLSEEKLVSKIPFPVKGQVRQRYSGDQSAVIKDNKMKLVITRSEEDYGASLLSFDLEKETITHKNIGVENNYTSVGSTTHMTREGNFSYYTVEYNEGKKLDLVVYDILQEKTYKVTLGDEISKYSKYLSFNTCRVEGSKLYLTADFYNGDYNNGRTAIGVVDINKGSLEYLGVIKNEISYIRDVEFK